MSVAFMFQIFYAGYHGKNEGVFIETEFFSQPDLLLFICGETFRVDAAVTDKEMILMKSACYGILPDVFTDADDLIQLVNDIFFLHISQNAVCRVYHGDRRIPFYSCCDDARGSRVGMNDVYMVFLHDG